MTSEQYKLLMELRAKMKEYNELLLQVHELSKLPKPEKSELSVLQSWLLDEKGGNCFLRGAEAFSWDNADDDLFSYLTLYTPAGERDLFTGWITTLIADFYHRTLGRRYRIGKIIDEESGLVSYDQSKLNIASTVIATIFSSILQVLTILVLYVVKNTTKRICITIVFTAVFAAALAICTSARRVEIFAATAAFAAVEVVFIGSAISQ